MCSHGRKRVASEQLDNCFLIQTAYAMTQPKQNRLNIQHSHKDIFPLSLTGSHGSGMAVNGII